MSDKLDIRSIFRVDLDAHRDAMALIWDEVTGDGEFLDLDVAAAIAHEMSGRQLERHAVPVVHEGHALIAHVFNEKGQDDPARSVTFFAPVFTGEDQKIVEAAPIALNKGQELDFAMLVNFGCCSEAALSLVAMFHANGEFFVVQKDAQNVQCNKRGFFERLFEDYMHTARGSHAAMHALAHEHECGHHHDGFDITSPRPA